MTHFRTENTKKNKVRWHIEKKLQNKMTQRNSIILKWKTKYRLWILNFKNDGKFRSKAERKTKNT
jgi:hypothetical protein